MLSRRDFVAATLSGAAYARLISSRRASGLLRVGTVTDPERPDLDVGLSFGAAEANRTAMLFDWHVEREEVSTSGFHSDIHALVVSRDFRPLATPLPVLNATCPPSSPVAGTLIVADCRQRDESDPSDDRRVVLWHDSLERYGADALNNRYRAATGTAMTSDAWLGWFSMKMLAEAALRSRSSDPSTLLAYLRRPATEFDGHKGVPLRFDTKGRLEQPVYVVTRNAHSGEWVVEREIR
jgi:hypothetical protein